MRFHAFALARSFDSSLTPFLLSATPDGVPQGLGIQMPWLRCRADGQEEISVPRRDSEPNGGCRADSLGWRSVFFVLQYAQLTSG